MRRALLRLDLAFVTAHEKVPEAKKGNDGVLLLRRGALIMYTIVPYHAPCTSILRLRHSTREGAGSKEE